MLFNAKILVPSPLKVQKKIPSKQGSNKILLTILQDLISHLNDGKWQTLTMMQLNGVHVDTRNILFCNNFHIIHDSFEKKW